MTSNLQGQIAKSLGRRKTEPLPLLGYSYQAAVNIVCGVPINIPKKYYGPLRALMSKLDKMGVAYDSYAYTIVKSYWMWCKQKGMRSVPVQLFCGRAAWQRFLELQESTVKLPTPYEENWNEMVHKELNAARMYIGAQLNRTVRMNRFITLSDTRRMTRQPDPPQEVIAEAERLLGEVYGISGDYDNIIMTLMERRKK